MFLVLVWVAKCLVLSVDAQVARPGEINECFTEEKYIICEEVYGRPSKCDCEGRETCFISLNITRERKDAKKNDTFNYFVNGEKDQGPTIIANYSTLVVVDVFNNMSEDTSIHWHGMHQRGFPWMDGVGNITQYPIKPKGRFRYIFRAFPQGTHWYHSHMRTQRDSGLFGALIVRDHPSESLSLDVIDIPENYTLVLQERKAKKKNRGGTRKFCLPDGSPVPMPFDKLFLVLNGITLSTKTSQYSFDPRIIYYVKSKRSYRFRVIGAMSADLYSISIEDHQMAVVATDGYLVRSFTTDYLIVHVSERYDIIVKTKENAVPGKAYRIRVQTLAKDCSSGIIAGEGYAFLVYCEDTNCEFKYPNSSERVPGAKSKYIVLNCPMKNLPDGYYGEDTTTECHDVTALQLLYPTQQSNIPSSNPTEEAFFDFLKLPKPQPFQALVNGIHFELPLNPLVDNSEKETKDCHYPLTCETPGDKKCTHAFYYGEDKGTVRFVLSALAENEPMDAHSAHPIHMHGHSYFVAKVGYPDYTKNGEFVRPNSDITVPSCGNGSWTDGQAPSDISVNSTTVRKDVVIVPAGGYVVVYIVADSPGYWLMHCHIDGHLNHGMAIALGENIKCASTPPDSLLDPNATDFCITTERYTKLKREGERKCPINEGGEKHKESQEEEYYKFPKRKHRWETKTAQGKNFEKYKESQEEEHYKFWRKLFYKYSKSF